MLQTSISSVVVADYGLEKRSYKLRLAWMERLDKAICLIWEAFNAAQNTRLQNSNKEAGERAEAADIKEYWARYTDKTSDYHTSVNWQAYKAEHGNQLKAPQLGEVCNFVAPPLAA